MESVNKNDMCIIEGGNVVDVICDVIISGQIIYTIGGKVAWWHPIGWVCNALSVADLACFTYWGVQIVNE